MGLTYQDLDAKTRDLMLEEIVRDVAAHTLYLSDNLTQQGRVDYPGLLKEAVANGSDDTLAVAIRVRLNSHEKPRKLKSGEFSTAPEMRSNAHTMLAEGEFNRFYIRAVCRRAIDGEGGSPAVVTIYRAKAVDRERPESEAKIGQSVAADALLRDLRGSPGVATAQAVPGGPNSGLSVRLPKK